MKRYEANVRMGVYHHINYVTHEMALDAEDERLEGHPIDGGEEECWEWHEVYLADEAEAAIAAAVKQERERCADICHEVTEAYLGIIGKLTGEDTTEWLSEECARRIRALDNPPDPDVDNPLTKNPTERDWVEDFGSENGQYLNTCLECGGGFIGHKRRIVCKVCADNRR